MTPLRRTGDNTTTKTVAEKTIYKFTKGSSSYDLEVVAEKYGSSATVKKDVPSISATGAANGQATNNNTVFVDVVNQQLLDRLQERIQQDRR